MNRERSFLATGTSVKCFKSGKARKDFEVLLLIILNVSDHADHERLHYVTYFLDRLFDWHSAGGHFGNCQPCHILIPSHRCYF